MPEDIPVFVVTTEHKGLVEEVDVFFNSRRADKLLAKKRADFGWTWDGHTWRDEDGYDIKALSGEPTNYAYMYAGTLRDVPAPIALLVRNYVQKEADKKA